MKLRFIGIGSIAGAILLTVVLSVSACGRGPSEQTKMPQLQYTVSMPDPADHLFRIDLRCSGWDGDTVDFRMPAWMPGYYQLMHYARSVLDFTASDSRGKALGVIKPEENHWRIAVPRGKPFMLSYNVKADRRFVANNYLDTTRAYLVPAATFLFIEGQINVPVSVKVILKEGWTDIATGLKSVPGRVNEFTAPDFNMLYDCPLLMGNLEELPSFRINDIEHRFIAFNPGAFDRERFMAALSKVVQAAVDIVGDIPYDLYTFIGIGPGNGGIEHLNNTTVSFNGNGLDNDAALTRTMSFLAHEYFHNYNVKRIRPFELGPFDYTRENRTNLLWVSEGLSVYYQHMIVMRAGLSSGEDFLASLARNIRAYENSPGRDYQSLVQASYSTWSEGPFGNQGPDAGKSISVYDKGPIIGMILDLTIRDATNNRKSLDDVMQYLYREYYKVRQRGFTDAEFREACEIVAGIPLAPEFEYVCNTGDIDYNHYLNMAGYRLVETRSERGTREFTVSSLETVTPIQETLRAGWLNQ
jgi:predicted metalloprotease with PDZ domain